jgi:OOP family OmpA-OmpF porin
MRARTFLSIAGVIFLGTALFGCSFSASASLNSEGKAVLKGKDTILVSAVQPAAPEPPPPPPPVVIRKAKRVGKKIEINEKVMFDLNKATIKVDSHELLNDVAAVIKENPSIDKIRVEGHTCTDGKPKNNKKLSQQRADAVKNFLVTAGVPADKLEAVGYGQDNPIADNKTQDGKEMNRRVEFNIVGEATAAPEPEEE